MMPMDLIEHSPEPTKISSICKFNGINIRYT